MLYISRLVDSDKYGVVDTDDGIEEVVPSQRIREAVVFDHIKINGVKLRSGGVLSGSVESIMPYQNPATRTPLQTKMQMLRGVEVVVYNGEIVGIYARYRVAQDSVRVELSKFASRMSWNAVIKWDRNISNQKSMVLVLDDSVQMTGNYHTGHVRVVWDISGVSGGDTVEYMYKKLLSDQAWRQVDWNRYVIDKPERMKPYRAKADRIEAEIRKEMEAQERRLAWR